jgi:fluoroacetyl-CoA thioesterase
MRLIPVGAKGSFALVIAPDHLADRFKDAMLPPVLATPVMIMMMENVALNAIKPYLDANESAVGTRVDVLHLAATPVGRSVRPPRSHQVADDASSSGSERRMGSRKSEPAPTSE